MVLERLTLLTQLTQLMSPKQREAYQEYLADFDPSPNGNGEDYSYPLSADAWLEAWCEDEANILTSD